MDTASPRGRPRIALVLQGGGALGAYQAGVYQALHEHDITPHWVIGTSIGALNAAIIAGNAPGDRLERLRSFWERLGCDDPLETGWLPDMWRQWNAWFTSTRVMLQGVRGFFAPQPLHPFSWGLPVEPEEAGFYNCRELKRTLEELVDFTLLRQPRAMRLTVSAINVCSGDLVNFDSLHDELGAEHVMASGALPPGFPAVRVGDDYYWDGGLYSNTPLQVVLDEEPRVSTLCFLVDLWQGDGTAPRSFGEVQNRDKDVRYASRSERHIDAYRQLHNLRRAVHLLYRHLPAELKAQPEFKALAEHGCHTTMHIVRLTYPGHDWNMASKDINFSRGSIRWRWRLGYEDTCRALAEKSWDMPVPAEIGVVTHQPGQAAQL